MDSKLWSAQVPPKVKLFIWKACLNILPTQTSLFDKGILNSFFCKWCLEGHETCYHILWGCEFAQKVWQSVLNPIPISFEAGKTVKDVGS